MRVVIDSNVVVSALLRATGTPSVVVGHGLSGDFVWIISEDLVAELKRVLVRPRLRALLTQDGDAIALFLDDIQQRALLVQPAHRIDVSRDPDDNRVLEAAVAGEADYIVTGDRDLLELASFEGISIVTPADS